MWVLPVDEVDATDALGEGKAGTVNFRHHAAADDATLLKWIYIRHTERGDDRLTIVRVAEETRNVTEVDETARTQGPRHMSGGEVRIDVVDLPSGVFAEWRNDRQVIAT